MKLRRSAVIGALTIAVAVFGGAYVLSGTTGHAGSSFEVTATFDRVGQLLRVSSDVKLRGVLVGKVAQIQHNPDGKARVTLALDPGTEIPANITATVAAKTLLGEKFVLLLDPVHPSGRLLQPGADIPLGHTDPPLEIDSAIQALVPLLDATDPGDLGGSLHALAVALGGQEDEARDAISNSLIVLQVLAEHKDELDRLLAGMPESSGALASSSEDLVGSLRSLDTLSRALSADSANLRAVLADAPTVLERLSALVERRYNDLVDLTVKGADILDLVASHKDSLPATVAALKTFTQDWDTNLSIPCTNAAGQTIGELHPTLEGTTCWQLWVVTAEQLKDPGGYDGDGPLPATNTASLTSAAFRAQVGQFLALPFGSEPSDVALLLSSALADRRGLLPGGVL